VIRVSHKMVVTSVYAHIQKYGKLVLPDGRVHPSSQYDVTGRSADFPSPASFLPYRLLGQRALELDQIDPKARTIGGLFVRRVDHWVALMRVRFRSEGGEASTSRPYLQATSCLIQDTDWEEQPSAVLAWAGKELRAVPDEWKDPRSTRFAMPRLEVPVDPAARFTCQMFQQLGEEGDRGNEAAKKECDAIARVVQLTQPGAHYAAPSVFGTDVFAGEPEFLSTVGKAFDLFEDPDVTGRPPFEFHIASGLRVAGEGLRVAELGLRLHYFPSGNRTTAPAANWRAVIEKLKLKPPQKSVARSEPVHEHASGPRAIRSLASGPLDILKPRESGHAGYGPDENPMELPPHGLIYNPDEAAFDGPTPVVHKQQQEISARFGGGSPGVSRRLLDVWRGALEHYSGSHHERDAGGLICATIDLFNAYGDTDVRELITVRQRHALRAAAALYGQAGEAERFSLRELLIYANATAQAYAWSAQSPNPTVKMKVAEFIARSVETVTARVELLQALWPDERESLQSAAFFKLAEIAESKGGGARVLERLDPVNMHSEIFSEAIRRLGSPIGFYRAEDDPARRRLFADACERLRQREEIETAEKRLVQPPVDSRIPGLHELEELDRRREHDPRKAQYYERMMREISEVCQLAAR
jgi:hypothetical protein